MKKDLAERIWGAIPYVCFPALLFFGLFGILRSTRGVSRVAIYCAVCLAPLLVFGAVGALVLWGIVTGGLSRGGIVAGVVLVTVAVCYAWAWSCYFVKRRLLSRFARRAREDAEEN